MIEYKKGNLLDVVTGIIIHGCNAQGVMGSGVAKAIRAKWPMAYHVYRLAYEDGQLSTGSYTTCSPAWGLTVVNAITQQYYGRDPNTKYISYVALTEVFTKLHKNSHPDMTFHIPKIGAGLGGGDWDIISDIIETTCPGRKIICWTLD